MRQFYLLLPCLLILTACLESGSVSNARRGSTSNSSTSSTVEVPTGAILPFDSASCPTGWTSFSAGQGRMLVGAGSGNNDADGTALTARVFAATGGREYTTGIPAINDETSDLDAGAADRYLARSSGGLAYGPYDGSTTIQGDKADSNLPPHYIYTLCKKTGADDTAITDAIVATTSASCASNSAAATATSGRFVLGAGSGNTDADAAALTARTLGASGGREFTTGIPATTVNGNSSIPATTRAFAKFSNGYKNGASNMTTLSHASTDQANMPPYVVVNMCKATSSFTTANLQGHVVAFDLAACPTGWSAYAAGKGRILLGVGSGNSDADGTALTTRTLGNTGGWEYTIGFNVSLDPGTTVNTGPTNYLAASPSVNMFFGAPGTFTTLAGAKADSNMPPFYVVTYCTKD